MNSARKLYLDNIRWMTVVLVVIYHVVYMFNGVQPFGVIGPFREHQLQDCFQYLVYPWFMALLFVVSGMSARYYLQSHTTKQFLKDKTRKLLVPSTIGLFVFQWLLGMQLLLTGLPLLLCVGCTAAVYPLHPLQMLMLLLFSGSYTLLMALVGLFFGVKMPTLTWTSEIMPIKQGAPVMITLFCGFGYMVLLFVGFMLLPGWMLGFLGYMSCFVGANLLLSVSIYLWLRKQGVARFSAL